MCGTYHVPHEFRGCGEHHLHREAPCGFFRTRRQARAKRIVAEQARERIREQPVSDVVTHVIDATGFERWLRDGTDEGAPARPQLS